jgi:transglutaminase-like putative cysteine protease
MTAPVAAPATAAARTRRVRRARPSDIDHMVASVAVTMLSAVTAISMCRVFADWQFLDTLLVMVIGVHAASIVLRIARVPGWLAMPVVLLVLFELLALLFYRDTLTALFPTGETFQLMRVDLRLVWSQFPTAVAPVPSEGSFLLAAALGLGLVSMLGDAFAFRAYGRAEAVVPGGVLFIFTAALGTDRLRVGVAAAWFASALVVVAVLRALHGGGSESWLGRRRRAVGAALPATAMCAMVAALGAALIGPLLPGAGAAPLLETRQTQSDVTEVLSPLVDIRSRLVNRKNTEMFTVSSAAGRYWRSTGLTVFDGTTWKLPERSLDDADGTLNEPGPDAQIVQQQIIISRLGGELVPAAFTPVEVAQNDLLWLPETDTILLDDGDKLTEGQVFNVTSDVTVPSPDLLRSTSATGISADFTSLPSGVPDEAIQLAQQITAGQPTDYDKALALQNFFRSEFEYSLEVQRGHSDDAISAFLRVRIGYCEQFAGTFAVMARAVGLPARVAVGFTQGELRPDGRYHVLGKHAHAWPEVYFAGVGWVLFEPTPGRGAPGSEGVTGAAAAQDSTPGEPGDGEGNAPAPTTTAPRVTPTTERDPLGQPTPTGTTVPPVVAASSGGGGGPAGWIFLAILAVGAWAVAMPWLVRRITRTGSTPTEQVINAWHGTVGALQLAGASPQGGATPVEYAAQVEGELAVDHRSMLELARFVTRAIYSPAGVGEPAALRAAVLRTHLDQTARELMPWYRRAWSRLDPRLVRQRLVGDRSRRPVRSSAARRS